MKSKKQVRRNRKDRTVSFWLENGDNLLRKITNSRAIKKRISANFELLKAANKSKNIPAEKEALAKLNSEKYVLEDDWKRWINRSNQKLKDKDRKKIYIDKKNGSMISMMAQEGSNSRLINHIMIALSALGIDSADDLYTIKEDLDPFKDALIPDIVKTLHEKEVVPETSIVPIIKKMTGTMSTNNIINYQDLVKLTDSQKRIKAKESKLKNLEKELTNRISAINRDNEIVIRDKKIAELTQENLELEQQSLKKKSTKNTTELNKRLHKFSRTNSTSKK